MCVSSTVTAKVLVHSDSVLQQRCNSAGKVLIESIAIPLNIIPIVRGKSNFPTWVTCCIGVRSKKECLHVVVLADCIYELTVSTS